VSVDPDAGLNTDRDERVAELPEYIEQFATVLKAWKLSEIKTGVLLQVSRTSVYRWLTNRVRPSGWPKLMIEAIVAVDADMSDSERKTFSEFLRSKLEADQPTLAVWALFARYHQIKGKQS